MELMRDQAVIRDDLTGLANEWYFHLIFDFAFTLGDRDIPMTLALFELDGLEAFAERKGRKAREAALKGFGTIFAQVTRQTDVTARYGDYRFACLLMVCNLQGAFVFADRIRAAAEALTAETGLTLSVGLAHYTRDYATREDLLDAAHRALLAAKAAGGNTVKLPDDYEETGIVWEPVGPDPV